MGKHKAPKAKAILSALLHDKRCVVQRRAATGLALLGEPVKPLLPLLQQAVTDDETEVRVDSLKALGKAGDTKATPLAIKALEDKDVEVRRVALLGEVEVDRKILPRFMRTIEAHVFARGFAYRFGGDEYVLLIPQGCRSPVGGVGNRAVSNMADGKAGNWRTSASIVHLQARVGERR